ncbi:MAG: hypothetical protein PVSMB6_05280 [Steroidobacteraceae bacterium]
MATVTEIDALLPQTQCTRCGYPACRPYAQALAEATANLNQCPPGGTATIAALAALLRRPTLLLNPANGVEGPALVALIDEEACIGCAKCLPPCPVDAIVGAQKHLHTVVLSLCTGCELCVAPCPVDCISMVPRAHLPEAPPAPRAADNRVHFQARNARIVRREAERAALVAARKGASHSPGTAP